MSSNASQIINEIKSDLTKMSHKICRGIAEVALFDMQEAHSEIMSSYYAGYTPVDSYTFYQYGKDGKFYSGKAHGYRRTGNLRNNSIIPFGVVSHGDTASASVQISPANMDSYVNSTGAVFGAEGVFDLVWNQGIRGLPPGYRGHVGDVNISASPVGVAISGKPGAAMDDFMEQWLVIRAPQIADMMVKGI